MQFKLISINGHKRDIAKVNNLYGNRYGAYESFRLHSGKVFLLNEHFDRLKKSLAALEISWDDDRQKYSSWIADLCEGMPKDKDAFVRLAVILSENEEPEIIICAAFIDFFAPKSYEAETIKKTYFQKPEHFNRAGFRIKSTDYISANTDIKKSAGLSENTDGILLTPEGFIAEALTANVIWSKNGAIFTPPLDTGILAGTMRAYLMKENKITEGSARPKELESADEIILTSGASYLRPLSKINGIKKPGDSGPVFKRLYEKLQKDIDSKSVSLKP